MKQNETTHFTHRGDPKMSCSCCGKGTPSIAVLMIAEDVRRHFDAPVAINSGPRCVEWNRHEGGTKQSAHLIDDEGIADALDIVVEGVSPPTVREYLRKAPYAKLIAIGSYKDFTHIDPRGHAARW